MVDAFSVTPASLRDDAETWDSWREQVEAIGEAVPIVGRDLTALDFSILPKAQDVARAYAEVASSLAAEIATGAEQCGGVADKLTKVASLYGDAEQHNLDAVSAADD